MIVDGNEEPFEESSDNISDKGNILADLNSRMEAEKQALLAKLRGKFFSLQNLKKKSVLLI